MRLSMETKQAIYEAYVNGEKVTDIAEKFGLFPTNVSRLAISMGATPRKRTTPKEVVKVCPHCHRKIALKDAKFCCYCGADMRTEKDRLIERIRKGMELMAFEVEEQKRYSIVFGTKAHRLKCPHDGFEIRCDSLKGCVEQLREIEEKAKEKRGETACIKIN